MKICTKCGIEQIETDFYIDNNAPTGRRTICKSCCLLYSKEWRKKNPDKMCAQSKLWYARHPDLAREQARNRYMKDPEKLLVRLAKKRASEKGFPFSLSPSDITIPEFCPLLGIPLGRNQKNSGASSPSLDRIIPSLGYTPQNTWVISWRANTIKNDATPEELHKIVQAVDKIIAERGL